MNDPDLIAAFKLVMTDGQDPDDWTITITPEEVSRSQKYEVIRQPHTEEGFVTFIVRPKRETTEEILG